MIYSEWYIKNISGKDDGCKLGKGLKFTTNCFSYKDVQYLLYLLHNKYNIKTTIHKGNKENTQFVIYV
ncbi:Cytochrome b mRNA maturase bI2 [Saccharomyces cerevisiae]|nr:Cytochrome b mRNA maturase bI2 [Saccharomyces cerevisiae]ONH70861.1 Cytochrome b mRNA maturase bI2 [Saccharomyces cerevisiae]ONH71588.1 Cytochrome b mRNA maturase bI2 [Saccharomyces cerevisiae]ONH71591.1 Cytochrome b mRNA maturase bI2 [Saccharomyces cerevisiae]ONH74452.1 Cytochrome b mRNA maturase bI2 [Saccharomyces cerevisiae]